MAASGDQSQNKPGNVGDKADDTELDALLADALGDFDSQANAASNDKSKPGGSGDGSAQDDPLTEQFSDDLAREFEGAMKDFFANEPHMLEHIEKLADVAGKTDESPEGQKEFTDTLKEALSGLAQNTEGLQDSSGAAGGMEDEMMKMFSGMGLDGNAQDEEAGFMPMMQNMMKTLLSKEVLYPSLKEISEKYPKWLEENKGKISTGEYSNYDKQRAIIEEILAEFDKEQTTDTDDVKKKRFEKIMDLMQKMQDFGQPPKEIVGEMAPGLNFGPTGMPQFPGASDDACSVM